MHERDDVLLTGATYEVTIRTFLESRVGVLAFAGSTTRAANYFVRYGTKRHGAHVSKMRRVHAPRPSSGLPGCRADMALVGGEGVRVRGWRLA